MEDLGPPAAYFRRDGSNKGWQQCPLHVILVLKHQPGLAHPLFSYVSIVSDDSWVVTTAGLAGFEVNMSSSSFHYQLLEKWGCLL